MRSKSVAKGVILAAVPLCLTLALMKTGQQRRAERAEAATKRLADLVAKDNGRLKPNPWVVEELLA